MHDEDEAKGAERRPERSSRYLGEGWLRPKDAPRPAPSEGDLAKDPVEPVKPAAPEEPATPPFPASVVTPAADRGDGKRKSDRYERGEL